MEVFALEGRPNCGKTTTLRICYQLLINAKYKPVPTFFRDLGNGDFIDVLDNGIKRIGIVTQGDYVITKNSIANHLFSLDSANCIQAICACTTRNPKARRQVMTYNPHIFISKSISSSALQELIDNNNDALELFNLI